jgi:hypothetical protein
MQLILRGIFWFGLHCLLVPRAAVTNRDREV